MENPTVSTTQTNEVLHDFNKLKQEFIGRIQIISGSAEGSGTKGKGKEVETDTKNGIMNELRKSEDKIVLRIAGSTRTFDSFMFERTAIIK
ncbi:hypothetical protein GLOIN_2v1769208 [Rhizophagus irregularis DAOM 181602=DAOM 197198]|nr:hypothetical protein GLOIN_2v1769208 [Rhizophagus irregularis DAOM 181602=DAOM 197198]